MSTYEEFMVILTGAGEVYSPADCLVKYIICIWLLIVKNRFFRFLWKTALCKIVLCNKRTFRYGCEGSPF